MSIKTQVVLDEGTRALLEELARPRGGNRSFVVREALRVYAAMEEELDALERTPAFRRMMESSNADMREGRLHPHSEAKRLVRRKR
jgi:predicted transcriptional regulator